MAKRAYLWLSGAALVVGALLLTDWLLWQPGLPSRNDMLSPITRS